MIKFFLIIIIFVIITIPVTHAVPLSDKTGFRFSFPVETDGHSFVVEATGNLQVTDLDFDKDLESFFSPSSTACNATAVGSAIGASFIANVFGNS